jgi:hypothetical protein
MQGIEMNRMLFQILDLRLKHMRRLVERTLHKLGASRAKSRNISRFIP